MPRKINHDIVPHVVEEAPKRMTKAKKTLSHTMLTTAILSRFEQLVDIDMLTDKQLREVEHDAFCACMGADSSEKAWVWFAYLVEKYVGIKLVENKRTDKVNVQTIPHTI